MEDESIIDMIPPSALELPLCTRDLGLRFARALYLFGNIGEADRDKG